MDKIIKIILAILFFLCLADMPYGYFQFVRFIALICFLFLANVSYQKERKNEVIVYLALALLFQPFFKIALGRQIWNMVDVIVGLALILSVFIKLGDKKEIIKMNREAKTKKNEKT